MYNTSLHYGRYVYPRWGKALGVCMATVSCLQILIWAIVAISKETGTLTEVCVSSSLDASVSVRLDLWRKLFLSCFFFFFFFFSLQRFKKSIRPLNSWRINNPNSSARMGAQMEPETVDAPFTVTLTDMDFNALTWEVGSQAWGRNKQPDERTTKTKRNMRYSSQQGWWSDCVLQGSVDFWFYLYCVYFSCIFIFYMV